MTGARLASVALASLLMAAGCYATYDGTTGSTPDAGAIEDAAASDDAASDNPYDTPVVCTSGTTSTVREGATMDPGNACIACHSKGEGPTFLIAGTVYPTAHEPAKCNGKGGVSVVITDSAGAVFTLPTNAAGNFACGPRARSGFPACAALKPPYSAKVVSHGQERAMGATQTTGDCNGCHTESGTKDAPGRIMAP